jgi:hypothetical protein
MFENVLKFKMFENYIQFLILKFTKKTQIQ